MKEAAPSALSNFNLCTNNKIWKQVLAKLCPFKNTSMVFWKGYGQRTTRSCLFWELKKYKKNSTESNGKMWWSVETPSNWVAWIQTRNCCIVSRHCTPHTKYDLCSAEPKPLGSFGNTVHKHISLPSRLIWRQNCPLFHNLLTRSWLRYISISPLLSVGYLIERARQFRVHARVITLHSYPYRPRSNLLLWCSVGLKSRFPFHGYLCCPWKSHSL